MNHKELLKSLTSFVHERATSPFVWIFAISFLISHWRDFLYLLFADVEIAKKIDYVSKHIEEAKVYNYEISTSFDYVLEPLFTAIIISLIYPLLTIISSAVYDFSLTARNHIARFFDKQSFLSKSESLAIREDRAQIVNDFHEQLKENQSQLRDSQVQFMKAQANCAALFYALGFGKGMESLLPNSELFGNFIVKNGNQNEILIALETVKTGTAMTQANRTTVQDLRDVLANSDVLNNASQLNADEFTSEIEQLISQGAITPIFRTKSRNKDKVDLYTELNLSQAGHKYCKAVQHIRNQSFEKMQNEDQ